MSANIDTTLAFFEKATDPNQNGKVALADLENAKLGLERYMAESRGMVSSKTDFADWSDPTGGLMGKAGEASDFIYLESIAKNLDPRRTAAFANHDIRKALDTATDSAGSDYVPTAFSNQFIEDVNKALRLPAAFPRYKMTAKQQTFPVEGSAPTAYLVGENTNLSSTITDGAPGTESVTLTAVKLAVRTIQSFEFDADSAPTCLAVIRRILIKGVARAVEDAIVNGDDGVTHMDSDITGATAVTKAWDGLRRKCLTDTGANVSLATFNADNLNAIPKAMGEYGADIDNLVWVVGTSGLMQLRLLRDSQNNLLVTTVDKYGPGASILTGEVGRLFGSPVIYSPFVRETLNAAGQYDGSTTTKTVLHLVWTPACALGDRQEITLETQRHIGAQATELVACWRGDFAVALGDSLTVGMGYNLTS